jgi:hypothetical protein
MEQLRPRKRAKYGVPVDADADLRSQPASPSGRKYPDMSAKYSLQHKYCFEFSAESQIMLEQIKMTLVFLAIKPHQGVVFADDQVAMSKGLQLRCLSCSHDVHVCKRCKDCHA